MASYNKEQAAGDEHNLIAVVMLELGLDISGAMAWAARYHADVQKKFIDGLAKVPSWGPSTDVLVKKRLDDLSIWPRGNHCWSYETPRSREFSIVVNHCLPQLKLQILWH